MEGFRWQVYGDGHTIHNPCQGTEGYLQQYQHEIPHTGRTT